MAPINPQVALQQRIAAQVVRRKLREARVLDDRGDSHMDACRIGLTLFCDSLFKLRPTPDSQVDGNLGQDRVIGSAAASDL